jgi:hypothetical protein
MNVSLQGERAMRGVTPALSACRRPICIAALRKVAKPTASPQRSPATRSAPGRPQIPAQLSAPVRRGEVLPRLNAGRFGTRGRAAQHLHKQVKAAMALRKLPGGNFCELLLGELLAWIERRGRAKSPSLAMKCGLTSKNRPVLLASRISRGSRAFPGRRALQSGPMRYCPDCAAPLTAR